MPEPEKLVRVKWAGPNTPFIEVNSTGKRLYMTKVELVAMLTEIRDFVNYYHHDFSPSTINNIDDDEEL